MKIRACAWKNGEVITVPASINGRAIRTDDEAQEVINLFHHGIEKLKHRIDDGFYTREAK